MVIKSLSIAVLAVLICSLPASALAYGGGGFSSGAVGSKLKKNDAPVAQPAGEVLGASSFSFTSYLTYGKTGDEVMELQKILISKGYLKIAAPTGWYGPLTRDAVKAYQIANGIEAVGVVGPITRAALNKSMETLSVAPAPLTFGWTVEKVKSAGKILSDIAAWSAST